MSIQVHGPGGSHDRQWFSDNTSGPGFKESTNSDMKLPIHIRIRQDQYRIDLI